MTKISEQEVFAELQRLSSRSDGGKTTEEWAEKLSLSVKEMRVRLLAAKKRGWLEVGRRTCEALDGRRYQAAVYRIVKPAGKR